MRKGFTLILAAVFVVGMGSYAFASTKGSPKAAKKAQKQKEPSHPVTIAIERHIRSNSKDGIFTMRDKKAGKTRSLKLLKIHDGVHRLGRTLLYSCADFKDTKTGEKLDVDFDVRDKYGRQNVENAFIHKVNGKPRFTYDANKKRVEVEASKPASGGYKGSPKGSKKGS